MIQHLHWKALLWGFPLVVVMGCAREPEVVVPFSGPTVPAHFPERVYSLQGNTATEAGVALGRKLFYDPILSGNQTISCGTCHAQVHAFADHNVPISFGVEGRMGTRNTPALSNLMWYPAFNWDGGVNHIEIQPFTPITEHVEMDADLATVLQRLRNHAEYPALFEKAFGSKTISDRPFFLALAQFMSMLVSSESRYDDWVRGKYTFTEKEMAGKALFDAHCSTCHSGHLQTDFSYRQNGLRTDSPDEGRKRITQNPADFGKFRVPSLRNVALTYPYMHDGNIRSLFGVIEAYSQPKPPVSNLDPAIPQQGFGFDAYEKEALVAFLQTLTDWQFLSDPRFSETH
jgi:cytochrome c peroxidase